MVNSVKSSDVPIPKFLPMPMPIPSFLPMPMPMPMPILQLCYIVK